MTTPAINGAYVGLLAASDTVVSKYAKRRGPPLRRVPRGFELPGPADMLRLLHPSRDEAGGLEQRVARITAIASNQALEANRDDGDNPYEAKPGGYVEPLLNHRDRAYLLERAETSKQDQEPGLNTLCRYCLLFQDLLHQSGEVPIEVVSHSARIFSDFDPRTNISQAGINDFQLFMPQRLACQALERSHPLLWEESAPDLFDATTAARRTGQKPRATWSSARVDHDQWEETAFRSGTEYLYESARFPWNEHISAAIENIFAITDFADILLPASKLAESPKPNPGRRETGIAEGVRTLLAALKRREYCRDSDYRLLLGNERCSPHDDDTRARVLSYGYTLESCLRSSYGLGWEEHGGLDIDDGRFDGSAIHCDQLTPHYVAHLTQDDFLHLAHALARRSQGKNPKVEEHVLHVRRTAAALANGSATSKDKVDAVKAVAEALKVLWHGQDPWLVTISASKRLRYTYPRNGPTELWSILSWAAPALLFTFMNRSVCQLPHFLTLPEATPVRKTHGPKET